MKIETIKHIVKLQKAYDNILTNANLLRNQENKNDENETKGLKITWYISMYSIEIIDKLFMF